MSDYICKETMTRCHTPGMCSPHGGCQPKKEIGLGHIDLGQFVDWVWSLKAERDQLKAECEDKAKALAASAKDQGILTRQRNSFQSAAGRLKAENEALLDGMTQIMHATRLGDRAFAIACEVVGELSGAAMGKEAGHQAGPKTPGTIEAEGLKGGRQ